MMNDASTPPGAHRHGGNGLARWAAILPALALLLLLLAPGVPLRQEGLLLLLGILPAWAGAAWARTWRATPADAPRPLPDLVPALILFTGLLVSLFSSATRHPTYFFLYWTPETAAGISGMALFVGGALLLTPSMWAPVRRPARALLLVLVASMGLAALHLYRGTHGHALYRDDHPSMMFRLWEVSQTLPQLLNYIPYWNAGAVHYAGTACGLNVLGCLFGPLWAHAPVQAVYTPIIGFTFIVLAPLVALAALRIMGASWSAAIIAAVLSLGASRDVFLWLLHFGTVGASFSMVFILPVSACVYRVLWMDKREGWLAVVLVVSTLVLLAWPPGALMVAAIGLSALVSLRRWSVRKLGFLGLCAVVVLLVHAPVLRLLFGDGAELFAHVLQPRAAAADGASPSSIDWALLTQGARDLVHFLRDMNPLLVFLGIGSLILGAPRAVRLWLVPTVLALAVMAGWGSHWKPNLELGRMAIPLALMAIVPASMALGALFESRSPRLGIVRAAIVALLLLTSLTVSRLYAGAGHAPYRVMGPATEGLVDFIRANTPPQGRVAFAGRCVHYYGDNGHVAFLPYLTGHEMMACDYYHFSPHLVEYEYPPRVFRSSLPQEARFEDAYNVCLILAYQGNYIRFFQSDPARYEPLPSAPDGVTAFRVRRTPSMFQVGAGHVRAHFNRIDITLDHAQDEVVVKYAHVPGMTVTPPAELYAYALETNFALVGLRPHGLTTMQVRFRGNP